MCGMKIKPDDAMAGYKWIKDQAEYRSKMSINVWLLNANNELEETAYETPKFMSKVERAIMTGVGDDTYANSQDLLMGNFGTSVVPTTILELPGLEHYCQRLHGGPLALPNTIMRSRRVPKIVTFHPKALITAYAPKWLPPIVLGTVNRYMFSNGFLVGTSTDTGETLNITEYESPLATLVARLRAFLLTRKEV
jgi:hypothetical protein